MRLAIAIALPALGAALALGQGRAEAAFPGENGLIAFTSTRDGGDADVFVMGADGSAPINLTGDSAASDEDPSFSPDGTRIAFTSDRDGDPDVFVMSADGSVPTNLTGDSPAFDGQPAFSPDGTRIAFMSTRDGGDQDVFVMGADGSGPTNLTSDYGAFDGQPAFSPDGTRIAFTRSDFLDPDVFAIGADGSAPTNLTGDSAVSDEYPSFSPNGTQIAFSSYRDGGDRDVFVMGADGSAPTNLTSASAAQDFESTFSPDGTLIAFTRSDFLDPLGDIFVMGADGSAPMNLTSDSAAIDQNPDWQTLQPLKASRALTLDANRRKVRKGKRVWLSGLLNAPHNEAGCESAQTVELQRRKRSQSDAEFATFAQLQSDATGSFAAKVKVKKTFLYRARVAETEVCEDAISNTEKVKVKKKTKER